MDSAEKLEAGASNYGAVESDGLKKTEKKKINVVFMVSCVVVPLLIFIITFYAMSFYIRYWTSSIAYIVTALMFLASGGFGFMAAAGIKSNPGDSLWLGLICFLSLIGWFWAVFDGNTNFGQHIQPFYDLQQLNVYKHIDPSSSRGNQYMDFATLDFDRKASVNTDLAMAFKNGLTYCIAPVTVKGSQPSSYDFWAVGIDCCSSQYNYRCVPRGAHSGLRVPFESQRAYYQLAVEQAVATHGISVNNPVFFQMVADPRIEINELEDDGYRTFIVATFRFFCLDIIAMLIGAFAFAKA